MLTLIGYWRSDAQALDLADLGDRLAADGRVALDVAETVGYRSGVWRDPVTRARAEIDLGRLTFDSEQEAETDYPGWFPAEFVLSLPLAGPHWYVAEVTAWLETVTRHLPGLGFLISEDVGVEGEPGYGPGALDRPRVLAAWEACMATQRQGLAVPVMARMASLALWRYRRESQNGAAEHSHLVWPEALVLADGQVARSAALWADPAVPLALPPVELVVIPRPEGAGVVPADEVLSAAHQGVGLAFGGARSLAAEAGLRSFWSGARLIERARMKILGDHDFTD